MAKIKKPKKIGPGPYNPQKAEAYVGKGVLRNGDTLTAIKGSITPVPNGPLVKKKGQFKGSTLRNGGSTPAWTRSEGKDPKGGLNRKGVASYRRANPGSKLKMAVTTKPSKLKPGSKAANRRKSFCARSAGQMAKFPKAAKDPNSRLRLARKKWNC
jgi:hypothetical protein